MIFVKDKNVINLIKELELNFNKLSAQKRDFIKFFIEFDKFKDIEKMFNQNESVDEYIKYVNKFESNVQNIIKEDDFFAIKMIDEKIMYLSSEGKLLYVSGQEDDKKFLKEMEVNLYNIKKIRKALKSIKHKMELYIKAEVKMEKEGTIESIVRGIRLKNIRLNKIYNMGKDIENDIADIYIRYNKVENYVNRNCEYINLELVNDILKRCEDKIA
ncbi:MAG: hypothetical protein N4A47_05165 [Clostridia bacterium]|nr:hypothetical protein [Clostridia bacterium]